ncbi:MAG: MIP/aquaporin family protein [Limisphaerales bacterium]
MNPYLAEFTGTALLVLFGDGVVANVLLNKSKGNGSGWIVIATGWGLAVTLAVYAVGTISGAHLNPAVTIGLAAIGKFAPAKVAGYIIAQIGGAMFGALLVWLAYLPHWKETPDKAAKLAVFCTAPAIRSTPSNILCEMISTAALVFGALAIPSSVNLSGPGWATGFGPLRSGCSFSPSAFRLVGRRDMPSTPPVILVHDWHTRFCQLPAGGSDWRYAWIPVGRSHSRWHIRCLRLPTALRLNLAIIQT